MTSNLRIISRVAARYLRVQDGIKSEQSRLTHPRTPHVSFKYQPKETKQHKAERTSEYLRDVTGLQKGTAFAIADAFVRGRDVGALSVQKGWPIEQGVITGPEGEMPVSALASLL